MKIANLSVLVQSDPVNGLNYIISALNEANFPINVPMSETLTFFIRRRRKNKDGLNAAMPLISRDTNMLETNFSKLLC